MAIGRSGSRIGGQEIPRDVHVRGVHRVHSAAQSIGWNLAKGHLFPLALADGSRGPVPMSAQRMTAALQGHLRLAGLPRPLHHALLSRGSVTKLLAVTAVDEIMKIGRWKTESVAKYYIGSTTSTGVRRARDHGHAPANELSLSQKFESDFSACAPNYANIRIM